MCAIFAKLSLVKNKDRKWRQMSYILIEVMEDSIFVIDNIPVEYIILPRCVFEDDFRNIFSYVAYSEYENISLLYLAIQERLTWMDKYDIIDLIQNRILWDLTKIDIIRIN